MINKSAKPVLAMFAIASILILGGVANNAAYAGVNPPALKVIASNNVGTSTIIIEDNGPLDNFGNTDGAISVALDNNNFPNTCALLQGTTTLTKPVLGNVMMPHMDINWVVTTLDSVNGCDVEIQWTDANFEASQPINCVGSVGGTTNDEFSGYSVYSDDSNNAFGLTQQIFDTGVLIPDVNNAFSGGGSGQSLVDGMYSLTMIVAQSHGPGVGVTTSGDAELICEPSQVGGLEIPINSYSLFLGGLNTSLVWILPVAVTAVGGVALYKVGRR